MRPARGLPAGGRGSRMAVSISFAHPFGTRSADHGRPTQGHRAAEGGSQEAADAGQDPPPEVTSARPRLRLALPLARRYVPRSGALPDGGKSVPGRSALTVRAAVRLLAAGVLAGLVGCALFRDPPP